MKLERRLKSEILARLERENEVIVLYGPRQTGKTTLMKEVIAQTPGKALLLDGDELRHIDSLSSRDSPNSRARFSIETSSNSPAFAILANSATSSNSSLGR